MNTSETARLTVLGPTNPNIISLDYGINLAIRVRKECENIPIIGSVADLGTETDILDAISALFEAGVNGIELNISCPNVITMGKDQCLKMLDLLNQIRKKYSFPISLKLSPQKDYSNLLTSVGGLVDGLTLSNAYIGLIPLKTTINSLSPFKRQKEWSPSGVYGPFERLLTFNTLYSYNQLANENKLKDKVMSASNTHFKNPEKEQFERITKSAKKGDVDAMFVLGKAYLLGERGAEQNPEKAVLWLTKAAENDLIIAQRFLGIAYLYGDNGVNRISKKRYTG